MNYATIKPLDVANGEGIRVSLFVSGCTHHCPECFNREAWDFNYGQEYTEEVENKVLELLGKSMIQGLSLLGGEPFEPENQLALIDLLKQFKKKLPDKSIWCFSGFEFNKELLPKALSNQESVRELLELIDVLVDGRFVEELKSSALLFRGSSNQNIIDVQASLSNKEMVLLKGVWERKMGSGDIYEN